jgi:hypothetical protein
MSAIVVVAALTTGSHLLWWLTKTAVWIIGSTVGGERECPACAARANLKMQTSRMRVFFDEVDDDLVVIRNDPVHL